MKRCACGSSILFLERGFSKYLFNVDGITSQLGCLMLFFFRHFSAQRWTALFDPKLSATNIYDSCTVIYAHGHTCTHTRNNTLGKFTSPDMCRHPVIRRLLRQGLQRTVSLRCLAPINHYNHPRDPRNAMLYAYIYVYTHASA